MTEGSAAPRDAPARAATLGVLALGFAAILVLNGSGHLSYDSVVQLLDGRTGRYHSWHPPVMAWLLGLADTVARGPRLYVAGQAGLLLATLAAVVIAAPRVRRWAPLAAAALCALPTVLLWQAIVWKDVLFADLLAAGFVALAAAERRGEGVRWPLVALGFGLLGLAALVRQNGAVAPIGGALILGAILARQQRPVRAWATAGAALAVCAASVGAASAALAVRSVDGDGARGQVRSLQTYDLAGALARDPALPLDRLPPRVAANLRREAPGLYTPLRIDPIQGAPDFDGWTADRPALDAQWRELLLRRADLWLRHRLAVFGWMLAAPAGERCHSDYVGVDGDPDQLRALGIAPGQSPRQLALARYAAAFHRTPVYMHRAYALAAVALAAWLLRRRAAGDLACAGLLLTALAFAASFAVIGVACDYRYLYALDLAVLVVGFRAAATAGDATRLA